MQQWSSDKPNLPRRRILSGDITIACAIAIVAAIASFRLGMRLPAVVYIEVDQYFGADINRVHDYMTGQGRFAHFRSTVHPIFSFLAFPPTRTLMGIGFSPVVSSQIMVALCAGVTAATIYGYGRCRRLCHLDAVLLCMLFLSSAGFVFWWSVPETFAFGGMSIAIVFLVAMIPGAPLLVRILSSALSLAITTTNWLAALIAEFVGDNRSLAFRTSVSAFSLVAVLSIWQKAYVPTARLFFFPSAFTEEMDFVPLLNSEAYSVSIAERLASFWLAPWVSPGARIFSEQGIRPDHLDYGPAGWIALVAATAIAASALWTMRWQKSARYGIVVPAVFLLFQFILHMVYGDEPFLYSAHFMPALICIASSGFCGRDTGIFRTLVIVFVLAAGYQNVSVFFDVTTQLALI